MDHSSNRRRVPRRRFEAEVGLLIGGSYLVGRAHQVGEGGMMISGDLFLRVGRSLVLNFYLNQVMIIVRGTVRNEIPGQGDEPKRFGIEFENLGFQFKRELRNFVASQSDAH